MTSFLLAVPLIKQGKEQEGGSGEDTRGNGKKKESEKECCVGLQSEKKTQIILIGKGKGKEEVKKHMEDGNVWKKFDAARNTKEVMKGRQNT